MSRSDSGHSDDQESVKGPHGQVASCTDQAMESKRGSRATLDEKKENIDGFGCQRLRMIVVRGNTFFYRVSVSPVRAWRISSRILEDPPFSFRYLERLGSTLADTVAIRFSYFIRCNVSGKPDLPFPVWFGLGSRAWFPFIGPSPGSPGSPSGPGPSDLRSGPG